MRKPNLSSGWTSWEVVHKDGAGNYTITPVSSELAAGGATWSSVVNLIGMVQELGWPEAQLTLFYSKGKKKRERRIVKKSGFVWLLKCKPSCWRLYFYIYEPKKQIIYLHAVCKKQNKEDPNDEVKAGAIYARIAARTSFVTEFVFPSD